MTIKRTKVAMTPEGIDIPVPEENDASIKASAGTIEEVSTIGEFEEQVLLAILALGNKAFGADIADEVEQVYRATGMAKRRVTVGALYTTLDRLYKKDLVRYDVYDPASEGKTGRFKKYFYATPEGIASLEKAEEMRRMFRNRKEQYGTLNPLLT